MKKVCAMIIALALIVLGIVLMPTEANAAKLGNLTYTIEEGEVTITACSTKASGQLVIPDEIDGCPVTTIAENAFKGCDKITSVTIPSTLKSVGASAFDGCTGLIGVYISDLAAWCNIDFYNILSSPVYTAKKLYLNGEPVTELTIPEGVTVVKDYTFCSCEDLKSVIIPDGVKEVCDAFMYCTALTKVTIADSVEKIYSSFSGCTALPEIRLPDSLNYLNGAFMNCHSLKTVSNLHSIDFIMSYAFYKCAALTAITIPDTVTSIGYCAFKGCTSLTEIVIPDKVTSVGYEAFSGCTALKTLTIGSSLESIAKETFYDCTALETIYFNATAMKSSNLNKTFNNVGKSGNGVVVYIGANVTRLPSGLFTPGNGYAHEAPAITQVIFEEGSVCERLEGSTFSYCKTLTKINLPDSITSMGGMTFQSCTALTEIDLPASITSLGTAVFQNCTGLTAITIPEGVTSIGDSAFYGCTALTEVTIPASLTEIGSKAFYNCTEVTDIYITDVSAWCNLSLADVDSDPVSYRTNQHILDAQGKEVTNVVLNESVTAIRSKALSSVKSMMSITIPDSVTTIGLGAFRHCDSLKHVLYTGDEAQWDMIDMGEDNEKLIYKARHYNCTGEEITEENICTICGANLYYTYGDANGDDTVDYEDLRILCQYLADYDYDTGTATVEIQPDADANGDGKIDGFDVIGLKKYLSYYIDWIGVSMVVLGPQKDAGSGDGTVIRPTDARIVVESKEVTKEDAFTVTIRIENNPGFAYLELTPIIAPGLTLVEVENGDLAWDYATGKQYIWSGYEDVTGDDVLMTLTFSVDENVEPGNYQIGFKVRMFANYAEELLELAVEEADIQVMEPAVVGVPGDLDGNDAVDEDDVIYLLQHLLMPNDFPVEQPVDYDHNDAIDEDDVIYLLQHLLMPEDFPLY